MVITFGVSLEWYNVFKLYNVFTEILYFSGHKHKELLIILNLKYVLKDLNKVASFS